MARSPRDLVLVVDDDVKIARLVDAYLCRAGYRVAIAHDGLTALRMIRELEPALVILDLLLPELDGRAVAARARETGDVSIIMLTALGSPGHRVAGLDAGADDYLAKPFDPPELVARVRSVLRRTGVVRRTAALRYGDLMVDPGRRLARAGMRELELTTVEFDLLQLLVQARGRVLSRDMLVSALASDVAETIGNRTVDVYVGRLRAKLGESRGAPGRLRTVRGIGYRLAEA